MSRTSNRYLYAVRALKEKHLCVRAVDVAHYLGFSKASVSITLRQMSEAAFEAFRRLYTGASAE